MYSVDLVEQPRLRKHLLESTSHGRFANSRRPGENERATSHGERVVARRTSINELTPLLDGTFPGCRPVRPRTALSTGWTTCSTTLAEEVGVNCGGQKGGRARPPFAFAQVRSEVMASSRRWTVSLGNLDLQSYGLAPPPE